jgi:hypothetical protein
MMLQLIPLLIALCIGFACGYGVRELKSHRRSTAQRKQRRYGEDERQPGCFGLEDERGEDWKGSGAMKSAINESRPSL